MYLTAHMYVVYSIYVYTYTHSDVIYAYCACTCNVCVNLCVCVCVCMCVCAHVRVCNIYMYIGMHMQCTYVRSMYKHTLVFVHLYICNYNHEWMYAHMCMDTYILNKCRYVVSSDAQLISRTLDISCWHDL